MVRGKTEVRRIENNSGRQVTFSKRRNGLLKKAFELSVLCDVEVAIIIFSPRGNLYEFASSSSSIKETIERYRNHVKQNQTQADSPTPEDLQHLRHLAIDMAKQIELLEVANRKILRKDLGSKTLEELLPIEQQLDRSVSNIRARKMQLYNQEIQQLQQKESIARKENAVLKEVVYKQQQTRELAEEEETSDVETELFIGQPNRTKLMDRYK